jgi:lactate dehydrogenase-like 2-hydroxyacid dehydrogenase
MNLIAWSQNMTPEAAKAAGAILVSKDQLFEWADILTIHLVLSSRTRGLVGAAELERMKPMARLINASRGSIVVEQALISVLKNKQIAGEAIDVFDIEPLPPSHPFRTLDNVLQRRISATYRMVFARRSTRIPSRIFGSGSTPISACHQTQSPRHTLGSLHQTSKIVRLAADGSSFQVRQRCWTI